MTQTVTRFYRPGLVFKAKPLAQGHQECCRKSAAAVYTPDGAGLVRDEIPALWAEFGVYGGEYSYTDPLTEKTEIGSEFRGGYFNLDEQAREKGWADDEKEIVARHMLQMLNRQWCQFTLHESPRVGPPWPTYDAMHHSKIGEFAEVAGVLDAALAYEKQEKNRPSVVADLAARLAKASAPVPVEDLVAD